MREFDSTRPDVDRPEIDRRHECHRGRVAQLPA
jgi:hypothetical protein